MDRVTRSLLEEFKTGNQLQSLEESKLFEHFSGYLSIGRHYTETFSTSDISVGSGSDAGIDCIAIVVNGHLVTEPEEVEDLASTNSFVDATFVFVQSERSSSFDTAKIGQFAFGVTDFFQDRPQLPHNQRLKVFTRITKEIFDRSRLFKKGNPQCFIYYITTGKWMGDQNLSARRNAARNNIEDLGIFRSVEFECLGAEDIQKMYRETQNAISAEIVFSKRVVIPEIEGVEEAY
ncbi:MAG: AIPR protein, partial [Bacteroidota bacterium]